MGRPRTATAVLEARGAFAKDPNRARTEPVSVPLEKQPPPRMNENEKQAWTFLYNKAAKGVLQASDYACLYTMACLWAEYIQDPKGFPVSKLSQMRSTWGELGMSPSARAKLAVSPAKEGTGFEDV